MRHFLEIDDLTSDELHRVLDLAADGDRPQLLAGQSVALYFEKPSLRTRHSSETAVVQLGGHPVTFRKDEIGGTGREPMGDIARVLSGYHALVGARVFDHRLLELGAIVNAITPSALRLAPSLLISDDEIDHAIELLGDAL